MTKTWFVFQVWNDKFVFTMTVSLNGIFGLGLAEKTWFVIVINLWFKRSLCNFVPINIAWWSDVWLFKILTISSLESIIIFYARDLVDMVTVGTWYI